MDYLKNPPTCKEHTAKKRYNLVARVLAGEFQKQVAISAEIDSGLLSKWVQIYNEDLDKKKGRESKDDKKINSKSPPAKLTLTERGAFIRLRAETEYLRIENEAIKK